MHIVLRMASRTLMSLVLSATATMALAQERPRIPRDADPNDWEAYYDAGVAQLVRDPRAAEQLFTWASRLRPDRAEPLYARWVAYWARNVDDFVKYARGDEKTWRSPAVVRNDSLRERAMRRNPFVHQGLIVAVYDMLPGRFTDDPVTRGWIALGRAELPQALAAFGVAVSKDPKRNSYLRYTRAAAFVNVGRLDSAQAEVSTLLADLRAADTTQVGVYLSKEHLEYASGLLHLQARKGAAARAAFERAILENAAFTPAHAALGALAIAARDTAAAIASLSLAAAADPDDVTLALALGRAYLAAQRPADAVAQLRRATELEPYFSASWAALGDALLTTNDTTGAKAAYDRFMRGAAKFDPERRVVERKLGEIKGS